MKAEFVVKKLKNGVSVKVKGDLLVQHSQEFKERLSEDLPGSGTYLLSLREVTAIDATAFQLVYALKKVLKENNRQLSVSWPDQGAVLEMLDKTGFKQALL